MKASTVFSAISALALGFLLPITSEAATKTAHYLVLVDFSNSNPVIDDVKYARRVAADLGREVSALKMADYVTVATFGEYDVRKNFLLEKRINIYFRPPAAKRSLMQLIASAPQAVKSGRVQAQGQTNILAALDSMAARASCKERDTTVVVVSDGRENSSYGQLPPVSTAPIFQGCRRIVFLGLLGTNPSHTRKLKEAWQKWSVAAGFRSFKAIYY